MAKRLFTHIFQNFNKGDFFVAEFIYLTKDGYSQYLEKIEQVKKELFALGHSKAETVPAFLSEYGGFDADFNSVVMQEQIVTNRLSELMNGLRNIIIVEDKTIEDSVNINSLVTIKTTVDGESEIERFKLVAAMTVSLNEEVSLNCPLGKAIYQKRIGDEVSYEVRGTKITVQILKIE